MAIATWDGATILWGGATATWDGYPDIAPVTQHTSTLVQLIKEGAQVETRADVYLAGVKQDEITILDGSVTFDATARIWRTCDLTVVGPIPDTPTSLLAPSGATLHLFKGARDWTGEKLLAPVGVYAFDESGVTRDGREVSISGFDYWRLVSDSRWRGPYVIARGTNLIAALVDAVRSRLPDNLWQEPNVITTSTTTGSIVWGEERENDPAEDIQTLAADDGLLIYFDQQGKLTIVDVPDPDDSTAAAYTVGSSPLLLNTARTLKGRPYNIVDARWEGDVDEDPIEASAEDDNVNSPSYTGTIGDIPYFMTYGMVDQPTESQVARVARGELRKKLGIGEVVDLTVVADPERDVWDVISVYDGDIHIDGNFIIDRMSMPLRAGTASITTRRRRI